MKKLYLILFLLIAAVAFAADIPLDPRLAQIQQERTMAQKDLTIAQLLGENAAVRLRDLADREKAVLAEIASKGKTK